MDKLRPPGPPSTDNPIIFLRAISPTKELAFLTELLDAHEKRNVDRAAKCVIDALSSTLEQDLVNAMVSIVNNLAYEADRYPPSMQAMLCKATDVGFHEFAYNAANQVMNNAANVRGYQEAERYFKVAMAYEAKPEIQAAAHVNYCPIIRDGLISGTPDWPAAVEIYETAAKLGLVKAMFNAGNVSSWLARKGDRAYGARAAYWFNYALEVQASRKPTLDMESPKELEEVYEMCMVELSALHIDALFDEAQLEVGISWARKAASKGDSQALHNLGVGYGRRLENLKASPKKQPGANWCAVLSQMDWQFRKDLSTCDVSVASREARPQVTKVDRVSVTLSDGSTFPLFVTHEPCLPLFKGIELLCGIAETLAGHHPEGFFLLSRKALFAEGDGLRHMPIYVFHNGKFSCQPLSITSSPDLILKHAKEGVDFFDQRFGNGNCMIPIAVNALDEGFVVAEDADYSKPWVGVGGPWRMPYLDESQLGKLGIILERKV